MPLFSHSSIFINAFGFKRCLFNVMKKTQDDPGLWNAHSSLSGFNPFQGISLGEGVTKLRNDKNH